MELKFIRSENWQHGAKCTDCGRPQLYGSRTYRDQQNRLYCHGCGKKRIEGKRGK